MVVVLRATYQMSLAVSNTCLYSSLQLTQFPVKDFVMSGFSELFPNYPTLSNCSSDAGKENFVFSHSLEQELYYATFCKIAPCLETAFNG